MRKTLLMIVPLLVGVLLFSTCEEPTEPDTTPPTVSISSHSSGQTVNEIVTVTVTTQDNEEISKVEFFIDDSLMFTDSESPYEYEWNTTIYDDTSYTVKVISYDTSDNTTESQPIMLVVDNSESNPTPVELYPIIYQNGSFTITWSQNNDEDFSSYELYESTTEDMSEETLIYETDERTDTTYVVTGVGEDDKRYYQVLVEDSWGFQSVSDIQTGDSFEFVDEWVQCKLLLTTFTATDGSYYYETIYNWDGNSYEKYTNGEFDYSVDHNEYGIPIRNVSASGAVSYHIIFDKWKISEDGWINQYGDTTDVYTYVWDGLTATQQSSEENHHNSVITYNEYGLKLESHLINSNSGVAYNYEVLTYEEDGRRLNNHTVDGQLNQQMQWNGREFELIFYSNGEPSLKAIGEINEYYLWGTFESYSYQGGNWNLEDTGHYEYECPGFEQIYP